MNPIKLDKTNICLARKKETICIEVFDYLFFLVLVLSESSTTMIFAVSIEIRKLHLCNISTEFNSLGSLCLYRYLPSYSLSKYRPTEVRNHS